MTNRSKTMGMLEMEVEKELTLLKKTLLSKGAKSKGIKPKAFSV